MNNKDLYIKMVTLLRNENSKSTLYKRGDNFIAIRYETDDKRIDYSAKTLKELSDMLFRDLNII